VESEITKWSTTLQTSEGEAKYKVECTNCKKQATVPFEPKEGKPVYCKECLIKIKSGELKPEKGFFVPKTNNQENKEAVASLASLGIEFKTDKNQNNKEIFHPVQESRINNGPQQQKSAPVFNSKENSKNRNDFNKKKISGPSPLLRGLLEKIKSAQTSDLIENKIDIVEEKIEIPQPVSLSALKPENSNEKNISIQTKDVSDAHLANLKDAFSKIADKKITPDISKEESVVKDTEPKAENNQNNNTDSSWQSKKNVKEVPEEVLRKVLE
jgi:CxxC-x17-CxxC domain-containing protein